MNGKEAWPLGTGSEAGEGASTPASQDQRLDHPCFLLKDLQSKGEMMEEPAGIEYGEVLLAYQWLNVNVTDQSSLSVAFRQALYTCHGR